MLDQRLIDRAAAQAAEARRLAGMPPLKDDEGGTLVVPGLVWSGDRQYGGWQPPEMPPQPIDPRELARREHAQTLAAEAVAQIDHGLIAAARTALDASAAANAQLRILEAEKSALESDISEAAALSLLTIDKRIEVARKAVEQANSAVDPALAAMRAPMLDYYARAIYGREYQAARGLDQQAELLEQQAGDIRLSVVNARGQLENYLPPAEAPAVAAPVRRKRLFERKTG